MQPSLQELQSHLFFPSSHWPDRVVQEVSTNWCWMVETAGSMTRGTRKQKVAALKVIKWFASLVQGDDKVEITIVTRSI